jgi:hypothetical protein
MKEGRRECIHPYSMRERRRGEREGGREREGKERKGGPGGREGGRERRGVREGEKNLS